MSLALYRKYRSRSLDEVVGQEHVTKLLANAIKQGKTAHAYLFTGPKGVGKTSIARILAHEINNLPYKDDSTYLDIIEIDAASNNGVEDIRELRERVQMAPVSAAKKVYIIDEVHMLSKAAFNALLKTLEEPPEHVVFILATTDIDKLPETIISRTQMHTFRRAGETDIIKNLQRIAKKEKLDVETEAYELIARHSDGSFRDSVSIFDQLTSSLEPGATLTAESVVGSLGLATDDHLTAVEAALQSGDITKITELLFELERSGTTARLITMQLLLRLREQIPNHPEYLPLMDSLMDVTRSSSPDLKLLTTLGLFASRNSTQLPARQKEAVVEKPQPTEKSVEAKAAPPAKVASEPANKASQPKSTAPAKKEPTTVPKASAPFDWQQLLDYVRKHHVALHSVLSKCEPVLIDSDLTLYTKSAFYKKKLDDSKYRAILNESMEANGFYGIEIETNPGSVPLKNSQAAKVAAIMGGGEEVSVEDA
jgi:DNA polymerase-3 subunit gamma/tau